MITKQTSITCSLCKKDIINMKKNHWVVPTCPECTMTIDVKDVMCLDCEVMSKTSWIITAMMHQGLTRKEIEGFFRDGLDHWFDGPGREKVGAMFCTFEEINPEWFAYEERGKGNV